MNTNASTSSRVCVEGVHLEVRHLPAQSVDGKAPLVFLHEGLGSVAMWTTRGHDWPAALCKASGRAGWVYSRRGYGRSDPIPDVRGAGRHKADYMHREALDTLPALLRVLGVREPVLIGHSDGATIALLYAARHPVTACVAMAPHVMVESVAITAIERARQAYTTTDLRARLARHHDHVDNAFWQWNDVWLSPAFRAFDIRDECRQITAPLMLVQGRDDEYGTMAQLDEIQAAVPHAGRLELPACGHSPHRDQPERLTADLVDWLTAWP